MAHACRYTHIIILRKPRTHGQIAESHSFLSLSLFHSLLIPLPTFLKYVYPHVLCCSRNNAVRVSHPRRTSLRNVSFVLLTNLPGPARVLAPYRMERFQSGEREGERERENRNSSRNDLACTANTTTNLHEKEASFRINNGNATGFHFPASNRSLSQPFERPSAEFSPNGSSLPRIKRLP